MSASMSANTRGVRAQQLNIAVRHIYTLCVISGSMAAMAWRSPYTDCSPDDHSEFAEEWRREERARVKEYQQRRIKAWRLAFLDWFRSLAIRPLSAADTLPLISQAIADCALRPYPRSKLLGVRSLRNLLYRAGIELPQGAASRAEISLSQAQERILRDWAAACLRTVRGSPGVPLDSLYRSLCSWSIANRLPVIGDRRLGAWLRSLPDVRVARRSYGVHVIGLEIRRK